MNRLGGRWIPIVAVGGALALGACSSSSPAAKGGGSTTVPANTTPTTSTRAVPPPFLIHQRFATGATWELTTTNAKRAGTAFTVTLDVLNTSPRAASFAAATPGLFTMIDALPQTPQQYAALRQFPSSSGLASVSIPANGTKAFVITFDGVAPSAKHPVLWFHGHLLPGTQDASVWFDGV